MEVANAADLRDSEGFLTATIVVVRPKPQAVELIRRYKMAL